MRSIESLLMESSSNLVYLMISRGVHMMRSTVTMNYVQISFDAWFSMFQKLLPGGGGGTLTREGGISIKACH